VVVAELVIVHGGDHVEVSAALLHDAVEDPGRAKNSEGDQEALPVKGRANRRILLLEQGRHRVEEKRPWLEQRLAYIEHIAGPQAEPGLLPSM
jgi:hypothetical protein